MGASPTAAHAPWTEVEATHIDDRFGRILSVDADRGATAASTACATMAPTATDATDAAATAQLMTASTDATKATETAISTNAAIAATSTGTGPHFLEMQDGR